MIKVLVLLSLLSLSLAEGPNMDQQFNVLVYRGNIQVFKGKMSFNGIDIQGIDITSPELTDFARENPTSYHDIVYPNGSDFIIPLRNTGTWKTRPTTSSVLGVVLSSKFTTDQGDVFDLSIAFPLCCNDFSVGVFPEYASSIEEKRQRFATDLTKYFEKLKHESNVYISSRQTCLNIEDSKVDNEAELERLRRETEELEAAKEDVEKNLKDEEAKELAAERICASACLNTRIATFNKNILDQKAKTLRDYKIVLEEQLNSGTLVTEEEMALIQETYDALNLALVDVSKYNVKYPAPTVEKGKAIEAEKLSAILY
jgi:hypothetical protein